MKPDKKIWRKKWFFEKIQRNDRVLSYGILRQVSRFDIGKRALDVGKIYRRIGR